MHDVSAISIQAVGKSYRIWKTPSGRLTTPLWEESARLFPAASTAANWLRSRAAKNYRDFWALQDINLEVKKGESVGLIGRNGSGKSTLLQLIASTLTPTSGVVKVQGRVAALLELGAGFDAEFTGRENVYVNASILGLNRAEIDAQIDAIAAFAEIGDFFDQPVKTYSSGMVVRLAFAVAAHVKPDVLIVDEALSVGDARFQLKCARTIDRFISQGVTLLFVSHELSLVKRLCKTAVLMDQGQILHIGHPNDIANLYSKLLADGGSASSIRKDIETLQRRASALPLPPPEAAPTLTPPASAARAAGAPATPRALPSASQTDALLAETQATGNSAITGNEFAYGGESGEITAVAALDIDGRERTAFSSGETLIARMAVHARDHFPDPIYALTLKNTAGVELYGTNTLFSNQHAAPITNGESHQIDFTLPLNLPPGTYFLSFGFTHFVGDELVIVHRRYEALRIDVHSSHRVIGLIDLQAAIITRPL